MNSRMREVLREHHWISIGMHCSCLKWSANLNISDKNYQDPYIQWLAHLDTLIGQGEPQPISWVCPECHHQHIGTKVCGASLGLDSRCVCKYQYVAPVEPAAPQTQGNWNPPNLIMAVPTAATEAKAEVEWTNNVHPERKEIITHEQARESLQRFVNRHFNNSGDKSRASIPANKDDDDILLHDYITQRAAHDAERAAARQKRFEEWLPIYSAELVRQAQLGEAQWWWDNCSTPKAHLEPHLAALAAKPVESEGKK